MLSLQVLHPFAPRSPVSAVRIRPFRTQFSTHYIPPFVLPNRSSATSLARIPRASAAPLPPPEHVPPTENAESVTSAAEFFLVEDTRENGNEDEEGAIKRNPPVSEPAKKNNTVKLAAVFGLWYLQNVIFNIYNKKALNLFPYPWLLASFQLLVGSIWMAGLWASGIQSFPRVNRKFFLALLSPALFHTVGHISACISFSKVAVSFTHVIKASEPVFSVVFSALHGHFYPIHVWLSVMPIVAGCALAAVTEVSFNAAGLYGALISNVGFVLRNIYSKQSLYDFKHVDGLNLYGWISIVSFLYLFPVAVLIEGRHWVQGYRTAIAGAASPLAFCSWVLLSGVFYHLYNQSSYQALDEISPLTFSVGNTMKRVVVIIATVIAFRNPVRPLNALGSAIAIFGTFLYSQATAAGKSRKKAQMISKKES